MTNFANINQNTIRVKVDYYNENEKSKLKKYKTFHVIDNVLAGHELEIPTTELLTYYLFHRKRPKKQGWRNYSDISKHIDIAFSDLKDFIDFNGTSIVTAKDVAPQDQSISERLGVAIGLSLVNRIHGLTEADWNKIPEQKGRKSQKTLDYESKASDGIQIIQVENKGSSVDDNTVVSNAVQTQYNKITKKKDEISILEKQNQYKFPSDVKYGTITVIDPNHIAKCLLADPEPEGRNTEDEAIKLKVLKKLSFIYDWINYISPRSHIGLALANRINDLVELTNIFELQNIPLIKSGQSDFMDSPIFISYFTEKSEPKWFKTKSYVKDGPHVGEVFKFRRGHLFFLGVFEELIDLAIEQNFEKIMSYKRVSGIEHKQVECVVSENAFKSMELDEHIHYKMKNGKVHFVLSGNLHFSQEGLVWGVLPIKEGDKVEL